jgi:predicted  nucleic acid-binding Zn-ribbon protein
MLTKQDLGQIKKITHQVVTAATKPLHKGALGLKHDVSNLKQDMTGLKQGVSKLQKDISDVKKDVTKIRKDTDLILSFVDREYLDLRKRVDRIETHLHLPTLADF